MRNILILVFCLMTVRPSTEPIRRPVVKQKQITIELPQIEVTALRTDDKACIPKGLPAPLLKPLHKLSGFGYRMHPILKRRKLHTGIDIGGALNTPIRATGNGTVVRVQKKNTGYGYNIIIDHGYGYKTLYAHLNKINVTVGQEVARGEVIGLMGTTGRSTGVHLHYEVVKNGIKVNPKNYMNV